MTIEPKEAYDELIRRSRELATLASCSAVLGWDEQTYMPVGGAVHRGNQMAMLAGLQHERATDPKIGELLATVEGSALSAGPDSAEAANIRELRRGYERRTRLPRALVEELARTTSMAQSEWVAARAASDFPRFRPWLEKIIRLKREESACLAGRRPTDGAAAPADSSYDPLLDDYEPGARSADLAVLFDALRRELTPLVAAIVEASASRTKPGGADSDSSTAGAGAILKRSYPRDRQRIFGEAVAAAVGFDFRRGRLDVTAHPFCTGIGPGDCRITTRFDEHEFSDAFFGILHEVGHGLYEQGLDEAHHGHAHGRGGVVGGARVAVAALGEPGRPRPGLLGLLAAHGPADLPRGAGRRRRSTRFHAAVNDVPPSLIRVRADEATYNLHIIVRFELEQDLLAGNLAVADLPAAWNEKYREYLGVTPANDAEGCLQDIHWSAGLIGYFPTYTLGNVYAAQLFAAAEAQLGGLDEAFARGDFAGLLGWLREKIHRQGQRYRAADLVERVTGSRPDHRPLIDGLRRQVCRALWNLITRLVQSP